MRVANFELGSLKRGKRKRKKGKEKKKKGRKKTNKLSSANSLFLRKLHKSFLIAYFSNSILYSYISVNMEIAPTVTSLWNEKTKRVCISVSELLPSPACQKRYCSYL